MAAIRVEAIGSVFAGTAGTNGRNKLAVLPANRDGTTVKGAVTCKVGVVFGPPGCANVVISPTGAVDGVRSYDVTPITGQTWKKGQYVFAVSVTTGASEGHTICDLVVP